MEARGNHSGVVHAFECAQGIDDLLDLIRGQGVDILAAGNVGANEGSLAIDDSREASRKRVGRDCVVLNLAQSGRGRSLSLHGRHGGCGCLFDDSESVWFGEVGLQDISNETKKKAGVV